MKWEIKEIKFFLLGKTSLQMSEGSLCRLGDRNAVVKASTVTCQPRTGITQHLVVAMETPHPSLSSLSLCWREDGTVVVEEKLLGSGDAR